MQGNETDRSYNQCEEANSIYLRLRQLVLGQGVRPNEQLSVRILAMRFSTSTTKVREALIRLAAEGLIGHRPNGGFFTCPLVVREQQHAFELAFILLKQSVELFASHPDLSQLSKLSGLLKSHDIALGCAINDPLNAHVELIENGYREIAGLSGNSWIMHVIERFTIVTSYVRRLDLAWLRRDQEIVQDFRELNDYLQRRHVQDAISSLGLHFKKAVEHLPELVRDANARALDAKPLDKY